MVNKRLERDAVNICGAEAVKFIGRAPQAKRCASKNTNKWQENAYLQS